MTADRAPEQPEAEGTAAGSVDGVAYGQQAAQPPFAAEQQPPAAADAYAGAQPHFDAQPQGQWRPQDQAQPQGQWQQGQWQQHGGSMGPGQNPPTGHSQAGAFLGPNRGAAEPGSTTKRTVVIATAVVGALAIAGVGFGAIFGGYLWDRYDVLPLTQVAETDYSQDMGYSISTPVTDEYGTGAILVESLDIEVSAAALTIVFTDGAEAELIVDPVNGDAAWQQSGSWDLETSGNKLVVRSPDRGVTSYVVPGSLPRATLTLPRSLKGELDAEISLTAAELVGEGEFAKLGLEVSAGSATFSGAARELELEMTAGEANLTVADVTRADLEVTTADAKVVLTGEAPKQTDVEIAMGSLQLELPAQKYDVRTEGELTELKNQLQTDQASKHVVRVAATAAEVTLR